MNQARMEHSVSHKGAFISDFTIDPSDVTPFSDYVFAHNLEHTRACIAGGLSAQMLRNRKFAGKPTRNEGCPAEWFTICPENALFILERKGGEFYEERYTRHYTDAAMGKRRNEVQCTVIQNLSENGECGIGQDRLPLLAGKSYELRIIARANTSTLLTVQLTDRTGKTIYTHNEIMVNSGDWQQHELTLTPDVTDAEACLRLTFHSRSKIVLGALSLMPQGHFMGMRRDVIDHLKEMGISMLRWPGGNFAGEYRWQDGLLPVDMRAPVQSYLENETQPYTLGYDNHEIGTDEFIALCREVGAEPFLTINFTWNTPEENAAWVEYCNGGTDTPYGKLRAERGHAEPYNVRYWSLGNEMGFGHMEGANTPEHYAKRARLQANALKAVDADLELFTSGPYPDAQWTEKSAQPLKDIAPYASLHYYNYLVPEFALDYSSPEASLKTCENIVSSYRSTRDIIRKTREELGDGIHISFDEWNFWYAWYRPISAVEGIYAAHMLHMLMRESEKVDMPVCCYFQPVGEGAIMVEPNGSYLTAIGQAFALMQSHRGGKLCDLGSDDNRCLATIHDDKLVITCINDDVRAAHTFRLNTPGKLKDSTLLYSESFLPHTRFTQTELNAQCTEGSIMIELPPCSTARLVLEL